jgi:hypothetical protein
VVKVYHGFDAMTVVEFDLVLKTQTLAMEMKQVVAPVSGKTAVKYME